ncbi:DNA (cytosine-5)-methyltransferase DRM2 [Acorus calamus]|uniref:DNA (cytosine-5-)-methyltransferase n=1 Tax=Acorus calamus TaxID=4465 RepID=A0AAV9DQD7_ACOCL|nr:DNA (cytosine-5)-methyltransferase DRM2 [Acorus calamus]
MSSKDWTSDSENVDNISWESDEESKLENSGSPSTSNVPVVEQEAAAGPSRVGPANASCSKLLSHFVGMGFAEDMVAKVIDENGEGDVDTILETLLTYKVIETSTTSHSSEIEKKDTDEDFSDISSGFSDADYVGNEIEDENISEKDKKLLQLVEMGFSTAEAASAVNRCDKKRVRRWDDIGQRKRAKMYNHSGGNEEDEDLPSLSLPNPMIGFGLPNARKRGYIHNLPIHNRFPLLPLPPRTIFEAFPMTKKWWPSWDTRTHFNCLQTSTATAKLTERIRSALADCDDPPPSKIRQFVITECRKWNLVWVGLHKVAPLEPDEIEMLLGFPRNHTRGGGSSRTERYRSLGNSFQVDTVAYHFSVLKDLFPNGITLLSLFSGIGGAEVALHRLGIHLKAVVCVEISEVNRNIVRSWWEQTNQTGTLIDIADIQQLNSDRLEQLIHMFGGFDLVVGGSPCNNLTGSNRVSRDGLEDGHMPSIHPIIHTEIKKFPHLAAFAVFGCAKRVQMVGTVPPIAVTIFFGANDAALLGRNSERQHVPVEEYGENLKKMVRHLKECSPSMLIVLITPPPVDEVGRLEYARSVYGENAVEIPERTNEVTGIYTRKCIEVAQELGLPHVDLWSQMQETSGWQKKYLSDGLHLTEEGNGVVYEEVIQVFERSGLKAVEMPYDLPHHSEIDGKNMTKVFKLKE